MNKQKPAVIPRIQPECFICERIGGDQLYVPFRGHRHNDPDCAPGGCNWADWYDKQPSAMRTTTGDILRKNAATR